jgi:hypothetical protein
MSSGVLDGVLSAVRSWPGVVEGKSRFGGPGLAFRANGREFLHVHTPTRIDVRVTKVHAKTLRGDPRAILRPKPSDWVELVVEDAAGAAHAIEISRVAWQAASAPVPRRRVSASSRRRRRGR